MQHEKRKSIKSFFKGKGYYIALFACLLAVGVTGLVFYRHAEAPEVTEETDASEPASPKPGANITARPSEPVSPTKPALSERTVDAPSEPETMTVMIPVEGDAITCYAMEELAYNPTTRDWRVHNGIDIAAEEGREVRAAADGTVYAVYDDEAMGKTVVIRHANDYATTYSNLADSVSVSAGDKVKAGTVIGTVGSTAMTELATDPHLHFSVKQDGKVIDPADFFGQR